VPALTGEARRAAIADAAIRLVATRGLRGLTHRAVDTEAGLPQGSTSYYLRTRDALLTACVDRMLQRDLGGFLPTATDLAELLTGFIVTQVAERREDLLARYELSLEAVRRPQLRAALVQSGQQLRAMLADLLTSYGVEDAPQVAGAAAAMLDGLMYDQVAGAGSSAPPDLFEESVRRAVAALLDGLRSSGPR
jgi:DNA-binding transcriptional regulator YbjK